MKERFCSGPAFRSATDLLCACREVTDPLRVSIFICKMEIMCQGLPAQQG